MEPGRTCLDCEHFLLDLGSPNYSDYTPGECGEMECEKGHFRFETYEITVGAWRDTLKKAATCPDFQQYVKPEEYE